MGNFDLYSAAGMNSVEAVIWVSIGFLLLVGLRKGVVNSSKTDVVVLSILFVMFGGSDVVEVFSGAWWRPWWLLVWKTLNAIVLLLLAGKLYLAERMNRRGN